MVQAKLLRFLQEREFQRLGGTHVLKANVRVIAASNRDLRRAVDDGAFREDLYYRLQVFDIHMPPLRERGDDILLLADQFLEELSRSTGRPRVTLTPDAKQMLVEYRWPGNVRQLHNALERAAVLSDGMPIAPRHLALYGDAAGGSPGNDLSAIERRTIAQAMREAEGNKSEAARRLGITRTQLYFRLQKYGLDDPFAGRNGAAAVGGFVRP
jgi:DNA-binding NtrC family response regulator